MLCRLTFELEPGQQPLAFRASVTLAPLNGIRVQCKLRSGKTVPAA